MPVLRHAIPRLAVAAALLLAAGCQYSGRYIESREEVRVSFAAQPSTAVYRGTKTPGEYRFARFEGRADIEVEGGHRLGVEGKDGVDSRAVAQPRSGARLVLAPAEGDRVTMDHGSGGRSVLRFVTGKWADLVAGREVVLRFEDASWDFWVRASEKAFLAVLDDYREVARRRLEENQEISEARVLDFLVDEKPLVRASRRELLVFFETLRMQGGFQVTTRRKDPKYGWWSYELRPEVGDALVAAAEATAVVGLLSLEILARCACRCR